MAEQAVLSGELIERKTVNNKAVKQLKKINENSLKIIICTIFILLLVDTAIFYRNIDSVWAQKKTIVVPEDYSTISEAIKNADPGDKIFVKKGIYNENIWIDKPLEVLGESSRNTIVIGNSEANNQNVITITADNTTIKGFTIKSTNYSTPKQHPNGINIQGDNCSIIENNISNTFWGILCAIQSSTTINSNNITKNFKEGIRFYGGSLNTISNNYIAENIASGIAIEGYSNLIYSNKIENNTRGIGLGTSHSGVFGNIIQFNSESGIYFSGSNNTISTNEISKNEWGIYFPPHFAAPNHNKIYCNNFVNNNNDVHISSIYNINYWNYQEEGNFWSKYNTEYPDAKEIEKTGINDKPHVISENDIDNYPLTSSLNIENEKESPPIENPPPIKDNIVGLWHFDKVEPNLVTMDTNEINNAILGSFSNNINYTPSLVKGKMGNALSFDGWAYLFVPASPSLEIKNEITIDVWIYVKEFKNVEYNNIVIQAVREDVSYPKRILGLAINGVEPENNSSPQVGSLRGYIVTDTEGFNEIVTTEPAIQDNKWINIVFKRSKTSGMHLFVDGEEKKIMVTNGNQNPSGTIKRSTYMYVGHDSNTIIDELIISNTAPNSLEIFSWKNAPILSITAIILFLIGAFLIYYMKKRKNSKLS